VFRAAPFVIARYIFAGKTAIKSIISPQAAKYLVYGNNSIVPNNISKKPDIYTKDSLYGRIGGTIFTNHIGFVKCLTPTPT